MKRVILLLLLMGFMYCSPFTPAPSNVELSNVDYIMFLTEEWTEYKESYIRSFGELRVTGTIHNAGQGTAHNVWLNITMYKTKECKEKVYEGKSHICENLAGGETRAIKANHRFEFICAGVRKGVKFTVSND